jgi:uncharacterized protein involved in exopolysaccharide biosynthesis
VELAEYFVRIWRHKWIVLGVTVLAIAINIGVMFLLPRSYLATSVLEVGGINSYLGNPGTTADSSRQTLPSAIQADTQSYMKLLDTPSVSEEAKQRAQRTLAPATQGNSSSTMLGDTDTATADMLSESGSNMDYTYSSRAEAVRGSGTDVIYIDVTADKPAVVKAAADALATVLVEESRKQGGDVADSFVENIQKEQIDPIDKQLADNRAESEKLKVTTGGDVAARNVRIADLADQAKSLDDTRKQYTDIIARVRVNEALNINNLRMLSPAATPSSRTMPSITRSSAIAALLGLLLGILIVLAIDRPKGNEPARIF